MNLPAYKNAMEQAVATFEMTVSEARSELSKRLMHALEQFTEEQDTAVEMKARRD